MKTQGLLKPRLDAGSVWGVFGSEEQREMDGVGVGETPLAQSILAMCCCPVPVAKDPSWVGSKPRVGHGDGGPPTHRVSQGSARVGNPQPIC